MTNLDYRPEAILDQAAANSNGIIVRFKEVHARAGFRTRLYKALAKAKDANPSEPGAWDNLVIRTLMVTKTNDDDDVRLWIGLPSDKGFGITDVREMK